MYIKGNFCGKEGPQNIQKFECCENLYPYGIFFIWLDVKDVLAVTQHISSNQ